MRVVCPRCGSEGYLIKETRRLKTGDQTYYFVHHVSFEGGKRKVKKCAVGSGGYIHVSTALSVGGERPHLTTSAEPDRLLAMVYSIIRYLRERCERRKYCPPRYMLEKVAEELNKLLAMAG